MRLREKENKATIEAILKEEYKAGKLAGLRLGYSVVQRMFIHNTSNHRLLKPHSPEKIKQWGIEDLAELKAKIDELYEYLTFGGKPENS